MDERYYTRLFASHRLLAGIIILLAVVLPAPARSQPSFLTFESGQVRPLAMSPDGILLFAVNTPDGYLEIFSVDGGGICV